MHCFQVAISCSSFYFVPDLKTIKDLPDLSSIIHSTRQHVPLKHAREKSLATTKQTAKELENLRQTMTTERIEHTNTIQQMKAEIKRSKTDIDAINNDTYSVHCTFKSDVSERQWARAKEMNARLQATKDEIG